MQNYFQRNCKESTELFDRITSACDGLIYVSETDAPVVSFAGNITGEITREAIIHECGQDENAPVELTSFADLFGRLTAIREGSSEKQIERAQRFLKLRKLLEGSLGELRVFRVGAVRVDIFVVGRDAGGCVLGVTTKAVET